MKRATKINNKIIVKFSGDDFKPSLDFVKSVKGRFFNPKTKEWNIPYNEENIELLKENDFDLSKDLFNETLPEINTEYKNIKLPDFTDILYPYQKESLKFITYHGGGLLSLDMGLGKSLTSLMSVEVSDKFPLLIISPASIKHGFKKEYRQWFKNSNKRIKILYGYDSIKNYNGQYDIIIVNYDLFVNCIEKKKTEKRTVYRPTEQLKDFISNNFKGCILDEVQYLKSESKRYFAVKNICKNIPFTIGLSGTPIFKKPSEFYNILNILRPDIFRSKWSFLKRYCDPKIRRFGKKTVRTFDGLTNGAELNRILTENVMIRYMKEDVLDDLPEKTVIPVYMELDNYKKYIDELHNIEQEIAEGTKVGLQKISILRQLVYELKKESCFSYVDDLLENKDKLVLFCHHKQVIEDFKERYKGKIVHVDGSVSGKKRTEAIKRFQESKRCKIFIGNMLAAGTGIDGLQKVCDTVCFIEFPWNSAIMDQAIDRLNRIGQKNNISIYHFIGANTVEEDIIKLIDESRKTFNKVMSGESVSDDDLLTKLIAKIKKGT